MCYLKYPGVSLPPNTQPNSKLLDIVALQLKIDKSLWSLYGERDATRREHLLELEKLFKYKSFSGEEVNYYSGKLLDLALQTDKGIVLAEFLINDLRLRHIIIPNIDIVEKLCSNALSKGKSKILESLTKGLNKNQKTNLDKLLDIKPDTSISHLIWLKQSVRAPNPKNILSHITRLKFINSLQPDFEVEKEIHQNRLLKIAREGNQMTAQHLKDLEAKRRYATIVAILLDVKSTLIDEIIDMHGKIIGAMFNKAKKRHTEKFQESGKAINEKVRLYYRIGQALLDAKTNGNDPYIALESIISWDKFIQSISEAKNLSEPEDFDHLYLIGNRYSQIRRYSASFLEILDFKATPSTKDLIKAIEILRTLNAQDKKKIPDTAPKECIPRRWRSLVYTESGISRKFYELCILSELKGALLSGDIWIKGSRQFKNFDEYLIPQIKYEGLLLNKEMPLFVETNFDTFINAKLTLLEEKLKTINDLASQDKLEDVCINEDGLKITPLNNSVPNEALGFIQKIYGMMPHLKITELLLEVDNWTGFSRFFTHLKTGEPPSDRHLLLTTILADGINLGLRKMAEACESTTFAKLSWLQAWYIRDETYSTALSSLTNTQMKHPLASYWGDGTTSSSDGQRFKTGGHAWKNGNINPKYGSEPGVQFYTHISDQYFPFHTKVISVGVRDATHVLDGLLYHESDLKIEEHYTDTAGFTDHVFALMFLLGFKFAPRIRDLSEKKLFIPEKHNTYPQLSSLIGESINKKIIRDNWNELLRLAVSIKQGTVSASLMLRKLANYPRQNGLAVALRELGRIERTIFTLDWIQDVNLRRKVQVGLNKGEAKNALSRAVFFNRLGEVRDRRYENQQYKASGLNIVVASIILWNTVYLSQIIQNLKKKGSKVDEALIKYLSPLGWEHINLTGNYNWHQNKVPEPGQFRDLNSPEILA